MSQSVHHDAANNVIVARFDGRVALIDSADAMSRIESLSADTGSTRVLADATGVTRTQGVGAIFGFVERHTATARRAKLRIAVLPSREAYADYAFLETVARNRGWNICLFQSQSDAMGWLDAG